MTVIIARTSALAEGPLDEARERIRAYSDTGAEALMLVGAHRGQATLRSSTRSRPYRFVSSTHRQRCAMIWIFWPLMGYDSLKHLKDGGSVEELQDRQASPTLLRWVNRTDEFIEPQQTYFP